jgi:hypothetical protein
MIAYRLLQPQQLPECPDVPKHSPDSRVSGGGVSPQFALVDQWTRP